MVPDVDRLRPQSRAHRFEQQTLQPAAADRVVRKRQSGSQPARRAPHPLAELVEIREFRCGHRVCGETVGQSKSREFADRVGLEIHADAKLANLLRGLEDVDLEAFGTQCQGRGQARVSGSIEIGPYQCRRLADYSAAVLEINYG